MTIGGKPGTITFFNPIHCFRSNAHCIDTVSRSERESTLSTAGLFLSLACTVGTEATSGYNKSRSNGKDNGHSLEGGSRWFASYRQRHLTPLDGVCPRVSPHSGETTIGRQRTKWTSIRLRGYTYVLFRAPSHSLPVLPPSPLWKGDHLFQARRSALKDSSETMDQRTGSSLSSRFALVPVEPCAQPVTLCHPR